MSSIAVEEGRSRPTAAVLEQLSRQTVSPEWDLPDAAVVAAAERALQGEFQTPLFGVIENSVTFNPKDLTKGSSSEQLFRASLTSARLFLRAFEMSRDERFLAAARENIVSWAKYEGDAWLAKGFMWNDHAIAERALVLVHFWWLFRESSLYTPEDGERVLRFARRGAELLAHPAHYTARTNHALMQNLALMLTGIAFSSLPEAESFRSLARSRVDAFLEYYVSQDGAIHEHSAGYQDLGARLLRAYLATSQAGQIALASATEQKVAAALAVLQSLKRPDGSIPLYGNTNARYEDPPTLAQLPPTYQNHVFPNSGLAVLWSGVDAPGAARPEARQTVAVWSRFATRAHKHDDEGSVVLWAGRHLISNVGYWPYDDPRLKSATGWRGSNAPHRVGEADRSSGRAALLASGESAESAFLHLTRRSVLDDDFSRQVVVVGGGWLILDEMRSDDARAEMTVLWTVHPDLRASRAADGMYSVRASDGRELACIGIGGARMPPSQSALRGSEIPFGGFMALDVTGDNIKQTDTIELRTGSGNAIATMITLAGGTACRNRAPPQLGSVSATQWSVQTDGPAGAIRISRSGISIEIEEPEGGSSSEMTLREWDAKAQLEYRRARDELSGAALRQYPQYRDFSPWRLQATKALVALFLLQEALLWLASLVVRRIGRLAPALRIASIAPIAAWIAAGWWLAVVYFRQS